MEPSSRTTTNCVDVLIGGAGFAGLALAIALRQSLGQSFTVAVADPVLGRPVTDARASAIVAAARRLFETIGVWDQVEAQPILDMVVTDSRLQDAVRPAFLTFAGELEPGEPFAHMIENGPLLRALVAKASDVGVTLTSDAVAGFDLAGTHRNDGSLPERESSRRAPSRQIEVGLADGRTLPARLLVAADGAQSRIRERAGIASHGWSYGQSAIVTTVAHERDHGGRAEEHFLPAGPFAILPLKRDPVLGHRSSIVWTEETQEAARIIGLPELNSTPSSNGDSACASARSRRWVRAAPLHWACPSPAHSLPIGWRWWAMPLT